MRCNRQTNKRTVRAKMKKYGDLHAKVDLELAEKIETIAKLKFDGNMSACIRHALKEMLKRERALIETERMSKNGEPS